MTGRDDGAAKTSRNDSDSELSDSSAPRLVIVVKDAVGELEMTGAVDVVVGFVEQAGAA